MANTPHTVALTGTTGFVGRHVLKQLLADGHSVRGLVRDASKCGVNAPGFTMVTGDLFDKASLAKLLKGCDSVIHLVGIIEEKGGQTFEQVHTQGTLNMLEAAKAGDTVTKWVQMSALGVRPNAVARYHTSKWEAEKAVRGSGFDYTIMRPSIIHGPDGEFMQLCKGFWCDAFPPFVPFFSPSISFQEFLELKKSGILFPSRLKWVDPNEVKPRFVSKGKAGKLQPVFVEDVAKLFVAALDNQKASNETYPLGGQDAVTWQQLHLTVRKHLPKVRHKPICAVPVWYAKMIAGMPGVPFNRDQVIMSQEQSTCSIAKVQDDFDIELAAFEPTVAGYAAQL